MSVFNRILFAVKDTDPRRPHGLAKVIALAKAGDAALDLFHAVSAPLYLPEGADRMTIGDLKRDTLELHRLRLEKLAVIARRRGISVICTVVWDHPPHEAIVRHATETGADLIVAQSHEGGGRFWHMRFTDWELVRTSPIPVLLIRSTRPYRRPAILAAVDPVHAHAKPLDLDENILVGGRMLAALLRGRMHLVHASHPPLLGLAAETPFTAEDLRSHDRREFEKLMERSDMKGRHGHLVEGDPVDVIPEVAEKIRAGIVVMGAVSRSGLKRLFIGNTAERTIGKLACDVLIMKSGDFRPRVARRRNDTLVLGAAAVIAG